MIGISEEVRFINQDFFQNLFKELRIPVKQIRYGCRIGMMVFQNFLQPDLKMSGLIPAQNQSGFLIQVKIYLP